MAYLTLSDGTVFEGKSFGYKGDVIGEIVFNTGMTGYQELLTDPSYIGQIVNMTYPLIGNYGVNEDDIESDSPKAKGLIVRDYCIAPSNWRATDTLNNYLEKNRVVGLYSIDTRALTKKIRNIGTMNGIISQALPTDKQMNMVKSYVIANPVQDISTKNPYEISGINAKKVAVIDYGLKRNIINSIINLGYSVKVFPSSATAEDILSYNPNGIMLTNGPGDPKDNIHEIDVIKKLIGKVPIFGICLGHQLLALAKGGNTVKLKYGHRGANHPVKDLELKRVFITSQNHGYAVEEESIRDIGKVTHINWNDKTVEGAVFDDITFSVQFHPEAVPGPQDTAYLFERFKKSVEEFSNRR